MFLEESFSKPPIEPVICDLLEQRGVNLNVLRLDKIHPLIEGNKWFKLKHNLQVFQERRDLPILSFGGAYSNHLRALAAAAKLLNMKTIAVLRGELVEPLNPVLSFAREQGMELIPVSRSDYRRKHDPQFLSQLQAQFGEFHLLPEGGSNLLAVKGCEEIVQNVCWQSSARKRVLALCCGTGASMAGLISGLSKREHVLPPGVLGISVLKAQGYISQEVNRWLQANDCSNAVNWSVEESYHCGGYARSSPALSAFLTEFKSYSAIPLEPVYTGKLFFALFDMVQRGVISAGTEILAIHTGGIHS